MKKTSIFLVLLLVIFSCKDDDDEFVEKAYIGNVELLTQQEVDAFSLNGYTEISGNLNIGSWISPNNVLSLNSLNSITKIDGGLVIYNTTLSNLTGLDNLILLGSYFMISDNSELIDFCALTNLFTNGTYDIYGIFSIGSNAYNPTTQDIIDGNCSQ